MRFGDLPIRFKLNLLFLIQSCGAILLVGLALLLFFWSSDRRDLVYNSDVLARVLGGNVQAALVFNLEDEANLVLDSLRSIPSVVRADILDRDGFVFASYLRTGAVEVEQGSLSSTEGHRFDDHSLHLWRPIILQGDMVGNIYLVSSLSMLESRRHTTLVVVGMVMAITVLLSLFFSSLMQAVISRPLTALSLTVRRVAETRDYAIRVPTASGDEIGALISAFNHLLAQIEERDVALRRKEDRYRTIFNATSDGLLIQDAESGALLDVNARARELFGQGGNGKFKVDLGQLWEGPRDSLTTRVLRFARSADIEEGGAESAPTDDERSFWAEVALAGVHIDGAERVIASVRDVTERKRAQDELLLMRNLLKNIFDSMPSALIGVNADGLVNQWNVRAEQLTGLCEHEVLGRWLPMAVISLGVEPDDVLAALERGEEYKRERVACGRQGETRYFDFTVFPLAADRIEGAVIRIDDVTSRVRMEDMLVQTEKMMSVGGLAAGMAHEINNPLGGILQGAQNVQRRVSFELPRNAVVAAECGISLEGLRTYLEKQRILDMIQGIRDNGERAARIVANMLRFSRGSGGGKERRYLAELIDRSIDLAANDYDLKRSYDFKHISIVRDYEEGLVVLCMPTEIEQVILNMLKNAAQAMAHKTFAPEDGAKIHLSTQRQGQWVVLRISDNGPGIPQGVIKRIFEPFYTTKEVGEGTGLGLSVSYFIIVDNHGGKLSVNSAPGQGATFTIALPG